MSPSDLLVAFGLPALVSAIVLVVSWRPWNRGEVDGRWGGPLAMAAGFASAVPLVVGAVPRAWPVVVPGCIFYIALAAGIAGLIGVLADPKPWARLLGCAVLLAGASTYLLSNQLRDPEARLNAVTSIAMVVLLGSGAWIVFDRAAGKKDSVVVASAMFLLAILGGVVLAMSRSPLLYGRLGLALAGAVLPMVLMSLLRGTFQVCGSIGPFCMILSALLLGGKLFTDLTTLNLALLASAPFVFGVARFFIPHSWSRGKRGVISLVLMALPLATAVVLAWPDFIRSIRNDASAYE